MKSGSLFNLIRDKVTDSQLNTIYTLVTGFDGYVDGVNETPDLDPVDIPDNPIRCNWTACRLVSMADPLPDDIERCQ